MVVTSRLNDVGQSWELFFIYKIMLSKEISQRGPLRWYQCDDKPSADIRFHVFWQVTNV